MPKTKRPKPFLTPLDVAKLFMVHPQTVVAWAESGKLAFYKTPGGQRRFMPADVERLYAETFTAADTPAAS